jgi:formiminoglutamate deiminase
MAARIAAAAGETGIGLTLLPVLYQSGSLGGGPPSPAQRRFVTPLDDFALLIEESRAIVALLSGGNIGIAPHSLRAVTPDALREVVPLSAGGPIHIHAAEQVKEVEDCLAWSGRRPIEWLLENTAVDARWCVVHATHMTSDETQRLAASGATVGLCPVTEANLGDGIFNGVEYAGVSGKFGIGSDQNVLIGVADELRQLEYSQRLRHRARNVLAPRDGSTGQALFEAALLGGAAALGQPHAGIRAGARADLVALDISAPAFAGRPVERLLDCWIFASHSAVDRVWVGGSKVVEAGRHVLRAAIAKRFHRVMTELADL